MTSKPELYASDEGGDVDIFIFVSCQVRCFPDLSVPGHTQIGSKFPADFVAQPSSQLDVIDTLADSEFLHFLNGDAGLESRLEEKPLAKK